jgi:hypothetical protein
MIYTDPIIMICSICYYMKRYKNKPSFELLTSNNQTQKLIGFIECYDEDNYYFEYAWRIKICDLGDIFKNILRNQIDRLNFCKIIKYHPEKLPKEVINMLPIYEVCNS